MWNETIKIGNRTFEFETGRIARQAGGSVLLREGDTVILSTAVADTDADRKGDFLPLTVDYREQLSAIGRIPGSFFRREGRSSEHEVLSSRLADRSLRPLFPKAYGAETQVISTVLSYGPSSDAPVLGIIAAACAVNISPIPWNGPAAAIRVGRLQGELVAYPSPEQLTTSDLDLILTFSADGIVMIEGGARQTPDDEVLQALDFAREQVQPLLDLMEKMRSEAGVEKTPLPAPPEAPGFAQGLARDAEAPLEQALAQPDKHVRRLAVKAAKAGLLENLQNGGDDNGSSDEDMRSQAMRILDEAEARLMRNSVARDKRRVDGRSPEDIRPIQCEVNWLPVPHGSALFTRGETQAIVTLTLGSQRDSLLLETVEGVRNERFLLHYGFPPYSVGEVRPLRGPGRREVGHGALARRALAPVLPEAGEYPYTIRILSEITESNGSSSMATVCGGCLALMDGGVPIKAPVAGIAMGLIKEGEEWVVLSDILGDEDHLGDMDFKVAGTSDGITALQMDNKLGSLPPHVLHQAFEQARHGRRHILDQMALAISAPREEPKDGVPRFGRLEIATNRVRDLIGPGGRVIQEL
ncbi:MAG: polyribonucleotide nucleotidyltransferase, partial [Deltaproteobacteria bacterium]|nr:polyribonucleotide nucleotidyltransferase [Deltaproteobacteria bacterium]